MQISRRFLSLVLALLGALAPALVFAHSVGAEMAAAANNWLAALTPEQRNAAVFELQADERHNWHFIPRDRKGLPLKEMTPDQKHLAHALLSTALSHGGYVKANTIMSLEPILADLEKGKGPLRDAERYFVSIFGKPAAKGTWGWRFEGHHLALNFLVVNGNELAVTPSFFGANPAEVREGPRHGLRVLSAEEDLARQLVHSLTASQKAAAIYTNVAPRDIITGSDRVARPLTPTGLSAAKMNPAQRELLGQVIKEFVERYRPEIADTDLKKITKAGTRNLFFAWAGGIEPGQPHYYRVQGLTFLLEYDNTQNDANHVHAVWRDFSGDFGDDLLRQHYTEVPHGQ